MAVGGARPAQIDGRYLPGSRYIAAKLACRAEHLLESPRETAKISHQRVLKGSWAQGSRTAHSHRPQP